MINGIKIMNLEASDILKDNRDNIAITKDFNGVFPNSLLLNKVNDLGLRIKNDTTRDIVVVNFNYGYTPVKDIQIYKKTERKYKGLIKAKNRLLEQRKMKDNNKEKKPYSDRIVKISNKVRELKYNNKKLKEEIDKCKIKPEKLREILYKDGFRLDFYIKDKETKKPKLSERIEYTFWFRSPSKSKVGSICFINKKLYKKINQWQTMGIELPATNAKLVEFEAYKSLTSSAIESRITLDPATEILVVNDLDSYIEEVCCKVYVKDNEECDVIEEPTSIKNTLWDGMALLDNLLWDDMENSSIKVLRQHFFKTCGFRTYISKFFKEYFGDEYETATVKDRYGRDVFVKNIKCITTENSMKWEKFSDLGIDYDYWCKKVKEDNNVFGVCKEDHNSKYSQYQRMSYQMINSLPINELQAKELCQDSIDFINQLKTDNNLFLDFLEMTKAYVNANEMIITLYNHNLEFANSEFFRRFKNTTISEYKETLREGKLLTVANNLTVCGNPYTLLLHSVGALDRYVSGDIIQGYEDPTLPILEQGVSVYTTKFNNGEELAGFRSPHNSSNNICYFINHEDDLMNDYFRFNQNVIAINLIKTNIQNRMNGLDEDSDFCYVTNSKICVEASIKAQQYKTIVNDIDIDPQKYNNDMLNLARIDNELAKSKYLIGQSSNLAALALSWYWNDTSNKELERIVMICSVLAQCAIDNCKRLYKVDLPNEIARISQLPCMQIKINSNREIATSDYVGKTWLAKPYFWQFIKEVKEKENKKSKKDKSNIDKQIEIKQKAIKKKQAKEKDLIKHCLVDKLCPMDFIQLGIDEIKPNISAIDCIDNIEFIEYIKGKANSRQITKAKEIVKELDDIYKKHYSNKGNNYYEEDDDEWMAEQLVKTEETLKKLNKITMSEKTLEILVSRALILKGKNSQYKRKLLNCLYRTQKNFMKVWKTKIAE